VNLERCLTACLAMLLTATTEVFVCRDSADVVWFTDRPCPAAETQLVSDPSIVAAPPITPGERHTLDTIAARKTAPTAARTPRSVPDSTRSCAQARQGLDALRHQRRRGYPLSRAAELDDRERTLRAERERWCR
jgi:hypothetical protein